MAWEERPTASLSYTLVDETGSRAQLSLDVPEGTAMDVAMTAAGALRPLIQAITDCAVVAYSLTYSATDDAPEAPQAGSRVERKGVFIFRVAGGKTARITVPGILQAVVLKSGRIDEDRPVVAAFTGALVAVDAIFSDSNGRDLRSLAKAYERYRSTTRAWMPRDTSPDADVLPEVIDVEP